MGKEQNIVKSYKETTPNGKVENGGSIGTPEVGSGSNSKLSIPPSVSTPSIASIDSTTNTSPEKKKKSKKKKVFLSRLTWEKYCKYIAAISIWDFFGLQKYCLKQQNLDACFVHDLILILGDSF